jgi:hypothetical protein
LPTTGSARGQHRPHCTLHTHVDSQVHGQAASAASLPRVPGPSSAGSLPAAPRAAGIANIHAGARPAAAGAHARTGRELHGAEVGEPDDEGERWPLSAHDAGTGQRDRPMSKSRDRARDKGVITVERGTEALSGRQNAGQNPGQSPRQSPDKLTLKVPIATQHLVWFAPQCNMQQTHGQKGTVAFTKCW